MPEKHVARDKTVPLESLVPELIDSVHDLSRRFHRSRLTNILLIAVVLLGAVLILHDRKVGECNQSWAKKVTDRTSTLTAPGQARIDDLLAAYSAAALGHHVGKKQRAMLVAELDKDRKVYTGLPSHHKLLQQPDSQLVGLKKLIDALHANDTYAAALASNPLPSAPQFGCSFF